METTKILWSGLTGRTGFEAIKVAREMPDVDIVMGMTRRDMDGILAVNGEKFDGVDWLKYDLDMFGPHGLFIWWVGLPLMSLLTFHIPMSSIRSWSWRSARVSRSSAELLVCRRNR